MAVVYPFTLAMIAAGFIGFVMLVLKLPLLVVSTAVLGFYSACALPLYFIFKPVIEDLQMRKPLLGFVLTMSTFALMSAFLLIWEWLGGRL
jgi:hypothetical protein